MAIRAEQWIRLVTTYPDLNRSSERSPPKSMFGIARRLELDDVAPMCSGGMKRCEWGGCLFAQTC
jgi:hypothetical protein